MNETKGQAEAINREIATLRRTLQDVSSSDYQTPIMEMPSFQFRQEAGGGGERVPTTSTPNTAENLGTRSKGRKPGSALEKKVLESGTKGSDRKNTAAVRGSRRLKDDERSGLWLRNRPGKKPHPQERQRAQRVRRRKWRRQRGRNMVHPRGRRKESNCLRKGNSSPGSNRRRSSARKRATNNRSGRRLNRGKRRGGREKKRQTYPHHWGRSLKHRGFFTREDKTTKEKERGGRGPPVRGDVLRSSGKKGKGPCEEAGGCCRTAEDQEWGAAGRVLEGGVSRRASECPDRRRSALQQR